MRRAATMLIAIVLILLAIGIVMLYSTSSARGTEPLFYLKRQLLWLCIAIICGTVASKIDYHLLRRFAIPLVLITMLLLICVFVPGVGTKVKGSYRWLKLGSVRFEPSELAKIAVIIGMSTWMTIFRRQAKDLKLGLFYPLIGLGVVVGLVFLEPDYGTTFVTVVVGMAIMFAAGTRISHLIVTAFLGAIGFGLAILQSDVRRGRILSFLYPEKYPAQAYHLKQSIIAFKMGGLWGVGLGNSMQKRIYLPEAHTDFILAIIAEELGFLGSTLVLVLFAGIFICGMVISYNASDPFGRLLGFGITMMISLQAAFNVAVVTGCVPTKGLALPFISYGGSSLVMAVSMIGILLSIAQYSEEKLENKGSTAIKDRAHRI